MQSDKSSVVREHLRQFFTGHSTEEFAWMHGPAALEMSHLRIAQFAPGPKTAFWVYATIGAWQARAGSPLEFVIIAPEQNQRHVELLTMSAWYHRQQGLGAGHTFPIGEPWLTGSACEYFLVSLPYPFGPELEECNSAEWNVRVLWLLPITPAEQQFKIQEGQEALEQRFDHCALEYWNVARQSAVD